MSDLQIGLLFIGVVVIAAVVIYNRMQEAITLIVFCLFVKFVMRQPLTWNYYVGFAFVMIGVWFVFHFRPTAG